MSSTCWLLANQTAALALPTLAARLDTRAPSPGLTRLELAGREIPGSFLKVYFPKETSTCSSDAYARGSDLIVTYAETPQWPFRTQIYWRACTGSYPGAEAAVELIASVQTALLDTHPELFAGSRLPPGEALAFSSDVSAGGWQVVEQPAAFERGNACGGFLFRFAQSPLSYVEIVHPADFLHSDLARPTGEGISTNHRLFARSLEKGVILRARVLGLFVDRADDLRLAMAAWESFRAAPPPLTT